ncbi:MAG: YcgN family cysteine cluster protein [Alphaproteobacteria bacterium]|nr:YcgN family cysteine cluster protein [Alphaproteobacteria bacterium]
MVSSRGCLGQPATLRFYDNSVAARSPRVERPGAIGVTRALTGSRPAKTVRAMTRRAAAAPALAPGDEPAAPFWKTKRLGEMTDAEWESLCDGCGRCCLLKFHDPASGRYDFTDVACKLLDTESCRCKRYARRKTIVKDCIKLTPRNVRRLRWIPPTCAYRLVAESRDLYWWHPLVSGDPATVHEAGISVRGRVVSERDVPEDAAQDRIVTWPAERP